MTIYNQISQNKIRTYLIVVGFVLLLSGIFYLIGQFFQSPGTFFLTGLIFALFSSVGSYYYSDKIVLFTVGAKPATKEDYFDLYTVTENLALAAGLPPPKLYVIADPAPNAFATGRDPKHAVVCVTTGLLDKLDRTELEGVIAHEFSHVKNYDIRLATIVAVLVGTAVLVSDWALRSLWRGSEDREERNRGRNPFLYVILIISLILAPLLAKLIQLALSRKRELLADASGVLITRYPEGLARALGKIAADPNSLRSASPSTAHLFIANPLKERRHLSWLTSLFNTHPPIEERIRILRSM